MLKQIKKLTALLFVAATMFTFSSCNKDNNNDDNPSSGGGGSSANYPESVSETVWDWEGDANEQGIIRVGISFSLYESNCMVTLRKSDYSSIIYQGTYTYANGNGTMSLTRHTGETASATFSINGTTMTFKINGATYTLTKS